MQANASFSIVENFLSAGDRVRDANAMYMLNIVQLRQDCTYPIVRNVCSDEGGQCRIINSECWALQ